MKPTVREVGWKTLVCPRTSEMDSKCIARPSNQSHSIFSKKGYKMSTLFSIQENIKKKQR